ncbi:DUF4097 family beta strand repeat-containing protein [Streptomyces sp. NPDC051207]|uniref:DUF4097 family beta strand repeat-containing protein n=1 Tax=Streptomyces sp. NPDC051207 TaxID=3154641 RepID=UPI00343F3230
MSRTARRTASVRAVAGAVVVLVAGVSACAAAGDDKDPERRSFALSGRTLTVDSDDSALEIVAADGHKEGAVEVTRWFDGSVALGEDPEVTWEMKGDRLVLRVHCTGMVADCEARHRIEVPRGVAVKVEDGDGSVRASGFREALDIRTGDGAVRVSDSSGPLRVRTGDGSVSVNGSSGPLRVRTGDGSVRVTDTSGPVRVHTGDGSVSADVSSRKVSARTTDGSVHLELGAVPDLVEARTGDGSVTIAVPRETYRVTTRTGDGSVNVSVPRSDTSAHVVSAHTGDGKVTVRTAN